MKKSLFVIAAFAVVVGFAGCQKDAKNTDVKASEVKASSVGSSGAARSFKDKADVEAVINSIDEDTEAAIQSEIKSVTGLLGGANISTINNSVRSVSIDQVSKDIESIESDFESFMEDFAAKGKASVSINKSYIDITGIDDSGAVEMSIPAIKANISAATDSKTGAMSGAATVKAGADLSIDVSKLVDDSYTKNIVLSTAVNGNGKMVMKPVMTETSYEMSLTGNAKVTATINAGVSVCLPYENTTVGGKILATATFGVNIDDLSELALDYSEFSADEIMALASDWLIVNVKVSVYDDENNKVCDYIEINDYDELIKYVPVDTLMDMFVSENDSDEIDF